MSDGEVTETETAYDPTTLEGVPRPAENACSRTRRGCSPRISA